MSDARQNFKAQGHYNLLDKLINGAQSATTLAAKAIGQHMQGYAVPSTFKGVTIPTVEQIKSMSLGELDRKYKELGTVLTFKNKFVTDPYEQQALNNVQLMYNYIGRMQSSLNREYENQQHVPQVATAPVDTTTKKEEVTTPVKESIGSDQGGDALKKIAALETAVNNFVQSSTRVNVTAVQTAFNALDENQQRSAKVGKLIDTYNEALIKAQGAKK